MDVKEVFIDNHIKITLIYLGRELVVSADVPALPWCFRVSDEIRINDEVLTYSELEVPTGDVGKVELVGSKVAGELRLISIRFKLSNQAVDVGEIYRNLIKYITSICTNKHP